jgi:hypothetical protein
MQTEKSTKTQNKQTKIIEENERNIQFETFRANPPPKLQVCFLRLQEKFFILNFRQTKLQLN